MSAIEGFDTIEVTLAAGESISDVADLPTVPSEYADALYTFVDDGAGNAPATYDLIQERYSRAHEDWMIFDGVSDETAQSYQDDAVPYQMRVDLTNTSSGQATYRIEIISTTIGRR